MCRPVQRARIVQSGGADDGEQADGADEEAVRGRRRHRHLPAPVVGPDGQRRARQRLLSGGEVVPRVGGVPQGARHVRRLELRSVGTRHARAQGERGRGGICPPAGREPGLHLPGPGEVDEGVVGVRRGRGARRGVRVEARDVRRHGHADGSGRGPAGAGHGRASGEGAGGGGHGGGGALKDGQASAEHRPMMPRRSRVRAESNRSGTCGRADRRAGFGGALPSTGAADHAFALRKPPSRYGGNRSRKSPSRVTEQEVDREDGGE